VISSYQSERVDKFLDLSFAIVPFGSKRAMHSLNECIEMFLRPGDCHISLLSVRFTSC
jgi:hypothetical protein